MYLYLICHYLSIYLSTYHLPSLSSYLPLSSLGLSEEEEALHYLRLWL